GIGAGRFGDRLLIRQAELGISHGVDELVRGDQGAEAVHLFRTDDELAGFGVVEAAHAGIERVELSLGEIGSGLDGAERRQQTGIDLGGGRVEFGFGDGHGTLADLVPADELDVDVVAGLQSALGLDDVLDGRDLLFDGAVRDRIPRSAEPQPAAAGETLEHDGVHGPATEQFPQVAEVEIAEAVFYDQVPQSALPALFL